MSADIKMLFERAMSKVEKTESCWIWKGNINEHGYGRFFSPDRTNFRAHKLIYELLVGPVPNGLVLDHLCRNRACVNPNHLEPVTIGVNVLRGIGITAMCAVKTHCPKGHEYSVENTYVSPKRARYCRACRYEKSAERSRQSLAARATKRAQTDLEHALSAPAPKVEG